ncbi:MAG: hypothetical protein V7700_16440 [Halioglobus sp.]
MAISQHDKDNHSTIYATRLNGLSILELRNEMATRRRDLVDPSKAQLRETIEIELAVLDAAVNSAQPPPLTPLETVEALYQTNPRASEALAHQLVVNEARDKVQQAQDIVDDNLRNGTNNSIADSKLAAAEKILAELPPAPYAVRADNVRALRSTAEQLQRDAHAQVDGAVASDLTAKARHAFASATAIEAGKPPPEPRGAPEAAPAGLTAAQQDAIDIAKGEAVVAASQAAEAAAASA